MVPFRVISADPAWSFNDGLPGKKRGAAAHYRTQPLDEIKSFLDDRPEIEIADDALLFLWRVAAMQQEAFDVAKAWGFTVKSEIVWVKKTTGGLAHFGMGRFVRAQHETCLIASRGSGSSLIKDHAVRSVFEAPVGAHSSKPDAFYALVEKLASGPHLELFARGPRQGWTTLGLEAGGANAKIPLGKEIDEALKGDGLKSDSAVSRICGRFGFSVTLADLRRWDSEQMAAVLVWLVARCKRHQPAFLDDYRREPTAAE